MCAALHLYEMSYLVIFRSLLPHPLRPTLFPYTTLFRSKGLPVAWVLPKEGYCGMFEQDMNVTAGSKVKDLGYAFINYWLSAPVQKKWAEKFYWTPANSQVSISPEVARLIPVTP